MANSMLDVRQEGDSYRRIEVITGKRRRRRWTAEEKARILAEFRVGHQHLRGGPRARSCAWPADGVAAQVCDGDRHEGIGVAPVRIGLRLTGSQPWFMNVVHHFVVSGKLN
jgi:hypothetical protein